MEQLTAIEKQTIKLIIKNEIRQRQTELNETEQKQNINVVDIQNIMFLKNDIDKLNVIVKKLGG